MKNFLALSLFIIVFNFAASAQDDLFSLLDSASGNEKAINYTYATFKGTRIINGHSIETPASKELHFLISHRFGRLNSGGYEFFGLDQATIRLGFEYGLTDNLTVGIGRSSLNKTFDGFLKYKLLRQSTGAKKMPVTVGLFASTALKTLRSDNDLTFSDRLTYTYQVLIARKFNERLSVQLSPGIVHSNLVDTDRDKNDIYTIGIAARHKITKRMSINGEYFYVVSHSSSLPYRNAAAISLDIDTGGHIFQLHFSNAQGMIEKYFLTETNGQIKKGDIYFGFTISRVFNFGK
jgi:hypothetical protein